MISHSRHSEQRSQERFCSAITAAEMFRKARHDLKRGKARWEVSRQDPSCRLIFWKGITFVTEHDMVKLVTLYPHGTWRGAGHVWNKNAQDSLDIHAPAR